MDYKIVKQSVNLYGHATSISLESPFLEDLKKIAHQKALTIQQLIEEIDKNRQGNLSSAIRLYILGYWKNAYITAVNEKNIQH